MGVGGGAQSCACGGCRWVTHPHRSLLHIRLCGAKPQRIGFVENDLPPWRSGRGAAHGLTGGTVSWRVPYAGETPAAAGCLPSPRSAKPARTPCRPPGCRSGKCFALIYRQRRHNAGSGGQAVPTATSTVPPLSFSRCSCFPNRRGNDALRERLRLQISSRARAAAGWNRGQVESRITSKANNREREQKSAATRLATWFQAIRCLIPKITLAQDNVKFDQFGLSPFSPVVFLQEGTEETEG